MSKKISFVDLLSDLDDSKLVEQLTELWPKIVRTVRETNKAGSLTLTLTADLERGSMIVVSSKVTSKLPTPATSPTIFYSDEDGNTTRHDPKQMPLRNVTPIAIKKEGE